MTNLRGYREFKVPKGRQSVQTDSGRPARTKLAGCWFADPLVWEAGLGIP